MCIQNHVWCQRFPTLYNQYESLTTEQLGRALLKMNKGDRDVYCGDLKLMMMLLQHSGDWNKIRIGSSGERSQCRHKAFAYQTRFDQPALFVTLTPNTDNSLVLAHYSGALSMETLFDLLESLRYDCASTRLFMRQVDAFIKYVLGIVLRQGKECISRAIWRCESLLCDGRGTLHIHLLIWLNNCPLNSTAVERLLDSTTATVSASSIVTNNLPIAINKCGCSECGASFSDIVELPIPDSARKNPVVIQEVKVHELSLLNLHYSMYSQHFLRSALIRFRPSCWPDWDNVLSEQEAEKQATKEAKCRDTPKRA
ncbi:Helitron helicase-like domain [Phytophthora cactorum]|nr:Helitron helicase-like domain [Phytophthora cactorum]